MKLSRIWAARYMGISESGIRFAEKHGLQHIFVDGQSWIESDDLDAWKWRTAKLPSNSAKRKIFALAERDIAKRKAEYERAEQKRKTRSERLQTGVRAAFAHGDTWMCLDCQIFFEDKGIVHICEGHEWLRAEVKQLRKEIESLRVEIGRISRDGDGAK